MATLVGAGVALWGLAIGLRPLVDNSFLTQLATGHLILTHGIPRADPYSFTAHGTPWTVESWLAAVGMAALSDVAGGHGIQLFHAALTVLLALLTWRLTALARSLLARVMCVAPVLAAGSTYWAERPLLVGLVLLAGLVAVVERDRFSWWLVVPAMWVWVNVHGSWVLAGAYVVVRLVGRRVDGRSAGRLPALLVAVVLGSLAGAVNPLGPRLLLFPLRTVTDHQAFAYTLEWRHPAFTSAVTLVFLVQAGIALVGAVRRRSTEDGLVVVVFAATACLEARNIPVATIVMVPVLVRSLGRLGRITGQARPALAAAAMAALAGMGAVMIGQALRSPAYDLSTYPVKELAWVRAHGLLADRLATPDFVGNLLEAELGPGHNAFFDDRVDMYPLPLIRGYAVLLGGGPGSEAVLDRYRIGAVLWKASSSLARRLDADPRWRVVLRDPRWQVVVRSTS